MNILVTGGAGYIGAHVAKALRARGITPVTYDNLSLGHRKFVKWGPFEEGDITDGEKLRAVIARHRIEGVIHFAALANVGESVKEPEKYHRNNVEGTKILIEAMQSSAVVPIVFSSSCAVYGVPDKIPIAEDTPKHPISPYGETKLLGEQLLEKSTLKFAALRYFNAAGADPDGDIGEDHDPETHLIPLVLDAAAGRRESITVFGGDYPTKDGSCVRDYIHVTDLAEAHIIALDRLRAGAKSFAVNLGTGQGISVREIIAAARDVTGRDITVIEGARRPGDPPTLVSDTSLSKKLLGWAPTRSDPPTILADAWRWQRAHFGRT